MEARGEKINVSSCPSKEIAGLKKKMKMKMMTPVWERKSDPNGKAIRHTHSEFGARDRVRAQNNY